MNAAPEPLTHANLAVTGGDDAFIVGDSAEWPGWRTWDLADDTRFNASLGGILVRMEPGVARVRMTPARRHSNLSNHVHGGALLGFVDVAAFAAARGYGVIGAGAAVTLDLSVQFVAAGSIDEPLEARVELLRETGRLVFLRGLVVQSDATIASFGATIRKPSPAR